MKTLHIGGITPGTDLSARFNKEEVFVIGVKYGGASDLDYFLETNPKIQLKTRFKEVDNARYLVRGYGSHVLQPALLTWKE